MVDAMIKQSKHPESGFYLNNLAELKNTLIQLDSKGKKFCLLVCLLPYWIWLKPINFNLNNTIIMETGGMKGRRKELIRENFTTN